MNYRTKQKSNIVFLVALIVLLTGSLAFMFVQLSQALEMFRVDDYVIDENAISINENTNVSEGESTSLGSSAQTTFDHNFNVTTSINAYIDPGTGNVSCTDTIELYNNNYSPALIRISNVALVMNDSYTPLSGNWKLTNTDGVVLFEGTMGQTQSHPDYVIVNSKSKMYLNISCDKSGLLEQRYIGKNICKFVYTYDYYCPRAYANYSQKNSENQLTFYYDPEYSTREGENYLLNSWKIATKDYMKDHYQDITSIVVDKSFHSFKIDFVAYLFGVETSVGTLSNLKKIDMTYLDTSKAYCFQGFMSEIPNLEECIGLDNLDATYCSDFKYCFKNTKIPENLNLSSWGTSKMTDILGMFWGVKCSVGPNISNWDISNVTSLEYLFYKAEIEYFADMTNWDTKSVTSFWATFGSCYKAKAVPADFSYWVTNKVTTASHMFSGFGNQNGGVLFTLNLKGWVWSKMKDCYNMFYQATYLSAIYCDTYVNNVYSLRGLNMTHDMFTDCINLDERLKDSSTATDRTYAYPKSESDTNGFFTPC